MKTDSINRRAAEELKTKLANVFMFDISDPRLEMLCITGVDVSKDKSVAHIYVSCDAQRYDEVLKALDSAKGHIRSCLARSLNWRVSPQLTFCIDTSVDTSQRITEVIQGEKQWADSISNQQ